MILQFWKQVFGRWDKHHISKRLSISSKDFVLYSIFISVSWNVFISFHNQIAKNSLSLLSIALKYSAVGILDHASHFYNRAKNVFPKKKKWTLSQLARLIPIIHQLQDSLNSELYYHSVILGLENSSEVKSICYCSRKPKFGSQSSYQVAHKPCNSNFRRFSAFSWPPRKPIQT